MRTTRIAAALLVAAGVAAQNPLDDISDIMEECRRDILRLETGESTQARQSEVIARLQELIEALERREGPTASRGDAGGERPAAASGVPTDGGDRGRPSGSPSTAARKWGTIRPAERAAIEAELHARLSRRYREMLKRYFGRLSRAGR